LFKEREDILPLEHDPVGEFRERKRNGLNLSDEVAGEEPLIAKTALKEVSQAIETNKENSGGVAKADVKAHVVEAQSGIAMQPETKAEAPAAALTDDEKKKEAKAEAEASTILSQAKLEARTPEQLVEKVDAANKQSASSPQEEKQIENVLDVFRSEELTLDTTSSLSKELNDMDVYSLLAEMKQIAEIAKKTEKVS
jgi:hypothetical protein